MASYTPNLNLLMKDPVADGADTFNIETMLNENWEKIDRQVLRAMAAAAAYDAGKTYQQGEYCTQGGLLYRANQAIAQPEAWTAGHWTAISITDVIRGLTAADVGAVPTTEKGSARGVATLGSDGQVPYAQTPHLTGTVTLYVDAALGDDANPGTQQAPFRTIQAAIDSLPKDLGESLATIFVSPGQYDEDVLIQGFYRGGTSQTEIGLSYGLRLRGNGDDPPVVRSLRLVSNLIPAILVNDLNISGGMNGIGVFVQRCINVVILGCAISNCKTGISVGGYYTSGGTSAHIDGTTISNTSEFAVVANGQNHVYAESLGGTGNAVGFSASYGAHITTRSITMQATTEQKLYCGFIDEF